MPQILVTQANPAAGADFTVTVPAGKFWRVLSVSAQLVTDATVAARGPKLALDDGTTIFYECVNSGTGQAASSTCQYSFAPGCSMETASPASGVFKNFPIPECILMAGYRLRMITGAIQVGDQWSAIRVLVDEEVMEFGLNRRGTR